MQAARSTMQPSADSAPGGKDNSALAAAVESALELVPDGKDRDRQFDFQAYDALIEQATSTRAASSAEHKHGGAFFHIDGWVPAVWWLALLLALLGPVVAAVGVMAAEHGDAQGLSVSLSFASVLVGALAMTFSNLKPVILVRASVSAAWRAVGTDSSSGQVGLLPQARLALEDDIENHLAAALSLEPYEINATGISLASDGTVSQDFADR